MSRKRLLVGSSVRTELTLRGIMAWGLRWRDGLTELKARLTADCGFLILLEVVVDESKNERRLC